MLQEKFTFKTILTLSFLALVFFVPANNANALVPPVAGGETVTKVRQDCSGYTLGSDCFTSLFSWEAASGGIDFGGCAVGDLTCVNTSAVAQIEGSWISAETSKVAIGGWTTGPTNYIELRADSANSALKKGWDTSRYNISVTDDTAISINENYVRITNIQAEAIYVSNTSQRAILVSSVDATNDIKVSGARLRTFGESAYAGITSNDADLNIDIRNTIIGPTTGSGVSLNCNIANVYNSVISNTPTRSGIAISGTGTWNIKNNVILNTSDDIYDGSGGSATITTDYNASDDGDGTNPISPAGGNWNNEFVDPTNGNFTLLSGGNLKNAGLDLTATGFTTDIDGAKRNPDGLGWDIGADELPVEIYRSVGPGATTFLTTDSSHANTITLASGTATFSAALPNNIGVGDAVLIDTGGTNQAIDASDTLLFIHGRTDSTHYILRTQTGAVPGDIAINDTYQIYRAYTSLFNAEAGTKNTGIPISFTGGNRDLVANNEQWNIACYADAVDTTAVTINGWNTGTQNYIKVYTPVTTNEVGISQRHKGKYGSGYTRHLASGANINNLVNYLWIEGISASIDVGTILRFEASLVNSEIHISNCLIEGNGDSYGIYVHNDDGSGIVNIWNNISYNGQYAMYVRGAGLTPYIYNNTLVGSSSQCLRTYETSPIVKNNISQNCTDGYNGTFDASSDYNISDLVSDAPGANSKNSTTVSFVDKSNKDFRLAQSDTAARNAGANLTADVNFAFSTDIDGQLRNQSGTGWDIGADEGSVDFMPTVMQSGGDYSSLASWEAGMQTDLVADTTRVFSHGGKTGTIGDGASVTGLTSGATATVVHASATQILLENISGTFESGETVQVSAGNSVVISDNGNPANAVAKIDGAWTVADTSLATVDGWNTGANNYIKIYTTETARHEGKWDNGKYILSKYSDSALKIIEHNVRIEGLQLSITANGTNRSIDISSLTDGDIDIEINSNLFKGASIIYNRSAYIYITNASSGKIKIRNNLFGPMSSSFATTVNGAILLEGTNLATMFIYNNTFVQNVRSIFQYSGAGTGLIIAKNNIAQECSSTCYSGTFAASSSNNISSDATAPGTNSKTSTTVQFVDAVNDDFHLSLNDTAAKNAGADLISDANLPFTTDIDGQTRPVGLWDIGADEAPMQIYRSVGPNATTALTDDGSHARNVTMTSGTATFSTALASNIGVGDAVLIDTGGTNDAIDASDTILFIHGRTDSTHYTLRTQSGAVPADIAVNDTYQIFRAYTSLSLAEAGTKNTSIPINFTGGDRNLVTNNEQWNIACYANGTTADTTNVMIDGWNTSAQNYISVYANENDRAQLSAWNNDRYNIEGRITIQDNHVRVNGLQKKIVTATEGITVNGDSVDSDIRIINCRISGGSYGNAQMTGIYVGGSAATKVIIYNNIIENITPLTGYGRGIQVNGTSEVSLYNNVIYNTTDIGIALFITGTASIASNNAVFNTSNDFPSSNIVVNNCASDDGDGANAVVPSNWNNVFVDYANGDFRLKATDNDLKNAGTDLSATGFTADMDGAKRNPDGLGWDIGADEIPVSIYRSAGRDATGILGSDTSHARTVTLTNGTATFSAALADNIGVGDAVLIDTGGTDQAIDTSDTLLFIHGRTDSTHYTLRTQTGAVPSDIAVNDTYQIYRAYTGLSRAEAGIKNTSIPIDFTGGNRDLVTNNEQWNIVCYANGTTVDSGETVVDGWITSVQNYLKIYTPTSLSEVGASQRHNGKWTSTAYVIETTGWGRAIDIKSDNVYVQGLQISNNSITFTIGNVLANTGYNFTLDSCIVRSIGLTKTTPLFTIESTSSTTIINSIIYGNAGTIIYDDYSASIIKIYNSIITGGTTGISTANATYSIINSAVFNNGDDFKYISGASITNCASDDGDGTNAVVPANWSDVFVDYANRDFHLKNTDHYLREAGVNNPSSGLFFTDIDGQLRNQSGTGWDIGADEGSVDFDPTVMQTGGDYSSLSAWEAGMQTDLVADTTRVFSHGGKTGTIGDGASVTGLTSGATATVVHASATQILLENISGTFESGETVQVSAGNSVVISDNGNPANAVAKIDGAWTVADGAVDISGWETGVNNYIKIYTTETARHQGKWDDTKYNMTKTNGYAFYTNERNVTIDGLQIEIIADNGSGRYRGILSKSGYTDISNNIVRGDITNGTIASGIEIWDKGASRIWNNIVYNIDEVGGLGISNYGNNQTLLFNNTVFNCATGLSVSGGGAIHVAKNNIAQDCTNGFEGAFSSSSDYNISDLAVDAPGANSKNSTTVQFADIDNNDFHLSANDTAAKDAGADLSADVNLAFSTDIDGDSRVSKDPGTVKWDIGADEVATKIFRSVGPSKTDALATDSSHANTITLASGAATFSEALPDNIGVGDAVLIDTGGTDQSIDASDTLLFIHGRMDSTHFALRTQLGTIPTDIAINDTYQIFRAYTSLANAEAGTKNTSIPIAFTGGNRDLLANNEQWNIACYANGTTADTTATSVDGWLTGKENYIKIYTPVNSSEVGISQRHNGKWTDTAYYQSSPAVSNITVSTRFARIEGLQIYNNVSGGTYPSIINFYGGVVDGAEFYLNDNIIKIDWGGLTSGYYGCVMRTNYVETKGVVNIYNNVFYMDEAGSTSVGLYLRQYTNYVFNNTLYGFDSGIELANYGTIQAINNLVASTDDPFGGTFLAGTDYNATDVNDTPAGGGTHNKVNQTFSFADATNKDFHLTSTDTAARNAGLDLSKDANLAFQNDIDGQQRTGLWSIGADDGPGVTVQTPSDTDANLDINSGLLGYWSFNGEDVSGTTAKDLSGNNNNGTISGATLDIGKKGSGMSFDGVNDYVNIPSSSTMGNVDYGFTVSGWFKVNSLSAGNMYLTSTYSGNGYGYFYLLLSPLGKLNFQVSDNVYSNTISSVSSYNDKQWHQFVAVRDFDNGLRKLYIDGSFIGSDIDGGGELVTIFPSALWVGSNRGTGGFFNGQTDEIRLYDRVLSEDEIGHLYRMNKDNFQVTQTDKLTDGLVGMWSFDGPDVNMSTNIAYDRSGNGNNGTISGATLDIGKKGSGMKFDGVNQYVDVGNFSLSDEPFTVSAWFKLKAYPSTYATIWSASDGQIDVLSDNWRMRVNNLGYVYITSHRGSNSSSAISTTTCSIGEWCHAVGVWSNDDLREIYLNGIYEGKNTLNEVVAASTRRQLIGSVDYGGENYFFDGIIDEVRVYNNVFSAEEVGDLYRMGNVKIDK